MTTTNTQSNTGIVGKLCPACHGKKTYQLGFTELPCKHCNQVGYVIDEDLVAAMPDPVADTSETKPVTKAKRGRPKK